MKKFIALMLSLIMALGLFAGCGSKDATPTDTSDSDQQQTTTTDDGGEAEDSESSGEETSDFAYKVGVINVSDADENCFLGLDTFRQIVESDEFTQKVGHEVSVEWTSSDLDVTKQMSNAELLISKGVDAILMIGCDNDSSASVVEACNAAGVDIFMVVSESVSGDYKFIGFDEVECGYRQGKYIVDNAPEGAKVCIMEGVEGRSATIERGEGIAKALSERPDIEILAQQTGDFEAEKAMQVTEDWLQAYGDEIDYIITEDNKMGQGVVEVLKAANKVGEISVNSWIVSGTWDADLMREGYIDYAINVSFEVLGETCADVMANYYTGGTVEERSYMEIFDVTQENFAEYFG